MPRQPAPTQPSALGIVEFANDLGISRTTVYRLIKSGALKPTKIRGRTVIRRVDADAFLARSAEVAR